MKGSEGSHASGCQSVYELVCRLLIEGGGGGRPGYEAGHGCIFKPEPDRDARCESLCRLARQAGRGLARAGRSRHWRAKREHGPRCPVRRRPQAPNAVCNWQAECRVLVSAPCSRQQLKGQRHAISVDKERQRARSNVVASQREVDQPIDLCQTRKSNRVRAPRCARRIAR